MSNLFTPTYLYNKALPPSNKHSLNTFQQQRIDQTNLFLLYSNSHYSTTISNLTIKHTYKPKAPLWAKNMHPPLLTFSCITGNNKPFCLLITLLYFGNATLMTVLEFGDTPKINYTLLFNTSIPSTPTLKLALLTTYIPLIFWIATSLKITPNFQQKFFSNQQTHTNSYILNLIILHMSSKALLKCNYFATFIYHHIFMISCNPTIFLYLQTTTTTTTIYFNEVVFPSVLGLTSPMAFPQHFPPP